MGKGVTFGFIKENCGEVQEHTYTKSGFGGHIYGRGATERCGFYSKKSCNFNNCPIFNKKRGYENRLKEIEDLNDSRKK